MIRPASTTSVWPVISGLSSEAKNTAVPASGRAPDLGVAVGANRQDPRCPQLPRHKP